MDRRSEGGGGVCAAGTAGCGEDAASGECGLIRSFEVKNIGRENDMAVAADAGVVLELYKLRQEETLRSARKFMAIEFWPKDLEELRAVSRAMGTDKNAYWRQ